MRIIKKFLNLINKGSNIIPIPVKITVVTSVLLFVSISLFMFMATGNALYHYFMSIEMQMEIVTTKIVEAASEYQGKNTPVPWNILCKELKVNNELDIQVYNGRGMIIYNGFLNPKFGQRIPDMARLYELIESGKAKKDYFYVPSNGMSIIHLQNDIIFIQHVKLKINERKYDLFLAYMMPPQWNSFKLTSNVVAALVIVVWFIMTVLIYVWCKANFSVLGEIADGAEYRIKHKMSLVEPLPTPPGHNEQTRLVNAINHVLAELRKKDEEKKVFMKGASHELRHPISVIMMAVETIDMVLKNPTEESMRMVKYSISDIKLEAKALKEQVNMLSSYLDDMPVSESEMEILDIEQLVKDEMEKANAVYPRRTIEMNHKESALVRISQIKMRAIIRNLIENAVKYSPMDTPIQLSTKVLPNKKDVLVEIKDFGIGISEKERSEIFKPYYRADQSRTREDGKIIKGMGLGLAIVMRYAERMDIKISVDSELGKGSTFKLVIPISACRLEK